MFLIEINMTAMLKAYLIPRVFASRNINPKWNDLKIRMLSCESWGWGEKNV